MAGKRTVAELEVNLIYSMSWAMDRLLLDIESRLKGKGDGLQREKKIDDESYEVELEEVYQDDKGIHCSISVGTDYKPGDVVISYTKKK